MADDKNTANTSPFPEGYQPQSRRERREMEEYFARLAAEKTADEKASTEKAAPWAASAGTAEVTESDTKGASERDHEVVASAEASAASAGTAVATSSAAKNTKREETANEETIADEESAADVETTKDFSEMTPKERRKAKRAEDDD